MSKQPTSQEAWELIEELTIDKESATFLHLREVGDTAGKIAEALRKKGIEVNPDKARAFGYLHDVGRLIGPEQDHIINGYHYLKDRDFAEEYCAVSLTHSFPNHTVDCILSTPIDPVREKLVHDYLPTHQFSLEEELVCLSDLMVHTRVTTVEKRMIDVISRHGTWTGTQDCIHVVLALKDKIDQMLGYNLYDLFPEIQESL